MIVLLPILDILSCSSEPDLGQLKWSIINIMTISRIQIPPWVAAEFLSALCLVHATFANADSKDIQPDIAQRFYLWLGSSSSKVSMFQETSLFFPFKKKKVTQPHPTPPWASKVLESVVQEIEPR